ncbi:MAG: acyl-[ACP]--phospholipid O-acyltransferase [Magnetococcales bacterium]|nr:acyl-[ACP]--phospholipid O-acyltransferase [Magnetococcales bacterium]
MAQGQFNLLGQRRLLPLFITQFLGALNDNVFKNALVMLITYSIASQSGQNSQLLVTMAAGLFILPFFLFSAIAGQLADRMEKSLLIRRIKITEVGVMTLGAVGMLLADVWFLLFVLFLMGSQSAFFGPVKYAILPDHLSKDELIGGNALVEAGTFLAILLGTIAGGLTVLSHNGVELISFTVVALAIIGWIASRNIPIAPAADPGLVIEKNILVETWRIMKRTTEHRDIFLSILGISWFWLVGATYLAQFPTLTKEIIGGNEQVVTLFLAVFSVGIGIGSLLCNRLLGGEVSARYVPVAALGMALFAFDLVIATHHVVSINGGLVGVGAFLDHAANWRILVDLLLIAISGGIYIVPLYSIMQSRSPEASRSRIIAGNNIMNALFMVASALITLALLGSGYSVTYVFLFMAVANVLVAIYICKLLPQVVLKMLFASLFKLFYRVELKGWDNFAKAGEKSVIVVNHVSFLDAALLATFLPKKVTFAINTQIAKQWWVKPFLQIIDAFPLDPTNPFALKRLTMGVKEGRHCVIFPEGRITVTGALMKIYEGPGLIADRSGAAILPIRIDGAQFTPFSRLKGKVRLRWFPKITITMLPPTRFAMPEEIKGRERRRKIAHKLYDLLSDMMFETSNTNGTLFTALTDARAIHGGNFKVLEDMERKPVNYNRLITISTILGNSFKGFTSPQERVGLLLPNAIGAVGAFFGLQSIGRIPAMLNFSTGLKNMLSACSTAQIRTIITSHRFVTLAKLDETITELQKVADIVYLEDLKNEITLMDKVRGLISARLAGISRQNKKGEGDKPAVVLFTSGSEGVPKGVVLSHSNILSNIRQLSSRIDYNPTDIVFNALPVFHSFGLTGGLLLPSLSGIKTFLYPSPLHYRIVPEMVYDSNATILFGTDTFLKGYARVSNPYDYYSVRYVFAGAEKVKDETRRVWMENFGLRIFEGYGATETAPALSTNTAMHYRPGTVGRLLPGIEYRLEKVPGIEAGGRLFVSGPNIMLGYLRADNPGQLEPIGDGWYDTGDIVEIDPDGFVKIAGRTKRFAKVGGEMISLTAVESHAASVWPGFGHAVVSLPDPKRGEQLVLLSDCPDATRATLQADAKKQGISELMIPKIIKIIDRIPVLGTGKTDYVAVRGLVC